MAYVKTVWTHGVTPLDETNMNNLETQYDQVLAGIAGIIVMWSGLIAAIPAGWIICDGNGGTPNLLARFVEGVATAATNPGTTGGNTSKTTGTGAIDANVLESGAASSRNTLTHTHTIADIRPLFYDIAFLMKT